MNAINDKSGDIAETAITDASSKDDSSCNEGVMKKIYSADTDG